MKAPLRSALLALLFSAATLFAIAPTPTAVSPAGKRATIDLPAGQHIKNVGGRDGAGLCVFTSFELSARWQNEPGFVGFQKWMTAKPGGGWPEKLDDMIAQYCREKGFAVPLYVQHTGGDDEVLDLAIKTGRLPAVTYAGRDDFYRGRIAHMVNIAHLDETDAAIIDNNRPGSWVWMTRSEFNTRWRDMQGGWAVVLLSPPPPPATSPVQVFGQCPGGRCPAPVQVYAWHGPFNSEAGSRFWILKLDGVDQGVLEADGWHPCTKPGMVTIKPFGTAPIDPPADYKPQKLAAAPVEAIGENYGVDPSKIHQDKRYSISGQECDRDTCLAAMKAMLADDSGRFHATIVSDDDTARRAAIVAVNTDPRFAPFRDKVHVQGYRSADWPVSARGLKPGFTLQRPRLAGGGTVFVSTKFEPDTLLEALKHTDPNFTPPKPMPGPSPSPVPANPDSPAEPGPASGCLLASIIALILGYFQYRSTRT